MLGKDWKCPNCGRGLRTEKHRDDDDSVTDIAEQYRATVYYNLNEGHMVHDEHPSTTDESNFECYVCGKELDTDNLPEDLFG